MQEKYNTMGLACRWQTACPVRAATTSTATGRSAGADASARARARTRLAPPSPFVSRDCNLQVWSRGGGGSGRRRSLPHPNAFI